MKSILTLVITLTALSVGAEDRACALQDQSLLLCPAVKAPLVTELKEGYAVLGFTVQTDGIVHDVYVIESGGDERWIESAISALSQWRYRESDRPVQKRHKFSFILGRENSDAINDSESKTSGRTLPDKASAAKPGR